MDHSSKLQLILQNQKNGLVYQHLKNIKDGDNVEDIENGKDVVLNENSLAAKIAFLDEPTKVSGPNYFRKEWYYKDTIYKSIYFNSSTKTGRIIDDEDISESTKYFVFDSNFNYGIYAKDAFK
nr:3955_t:CDS:2 [Entrophospora candida]